MKVLIAGGAGYIGGITTRLFEEAGHDVTVFDNLSTGHKKNLLNAKLVEGDLLNTQDIKDLFEKESFDVVLDFAAKIQVEESTQKPKLYFDNNTIGPLNLIDVAVSYGVKNFIFSSTAAVYGEPTKNPIEETDPTGPINPYGWSKLLVEEMLKSYEQSHGLNWLAFRYFNVAGAYKGIGPDYPFMTHLIPSVIKAMKEGAEFQIFGDDYDTKDGTCVRDYIHVHDVARAHVIAAELASKKSFNQVINLGSDKGYSVLEVINSISEIAQKKVYVRNAPRRAGDPAKLIASNEKARNLLNWEPKKDLSAMIQDTLAWQK